MQGHAALAVHLATLAVHMSLNHLWAAFWFSLTIAQT